MNRIKSIYTSISILKDLLIIFFIYNKEFINQLEIFPSLITVFFLITYWTLFNYVLGQYEYRFKDLKGKIISNGLNTLIVLFSANFIYIIINLLTDKININISDLFIFINIIFKIFVIIFISQSIVDIFARNNYSKNNKWLVLADNERYEKLINLNSQFNNNYKIFRINKDSEEIIINRFKGLIIDHNTTLSNQEKNIYLKIKENNLEIINTLGWFEKYLQISPADLHSSNDMFNLETCLNFKNINFRVKRVGDIFFSLFLLFFLSPLILLIIICLFLSQGKPIFYSQTRSGLNGRKIEIIKFRTMIVNAEKNGPQWSKKNDKRITLLGKILRKFRLDELPQLLNVIKGDMSLIGPRPERPEFDKKLNKKIINYNFRYSIKPGLSGWAQVNYHYSSNLNDAINKLNYDIYYIKNQSTYLDFLILFKTIKLILNARGWVSKF